MNKRDIIILGPKRCGTTAIYQMLCSSSFFNSAFNILPKETNIFIYEDFEKIDAMRRVGPIIDVSPEYAGSFRAIFRLQEYYLSRGEVPVLILINRDHLARRNSLFEYLTRRGVLTQKYSELEFENMCTAELGIWKKLVDFEVENFEFSELVDFFQSYTPIPFEPVLGVNSSNIQPRSVKLVSFVRACAGFFRKSLVGARFVDFVSPSLRLLLYRQDISKPDFVGEVGKEFLLKVAKQYNRDGV